MPISAMRDDCFPSSPNQVRRPDDNSLLRLYDRARRAFDRIANPTQRDRARRLLNHIVRELLARGLADRPAAP
jgi:hypothetical protein